MSIILKMNAPVPLPAGARVVTGDDVGPSLRDLAPGEVCVVRGVRAAGAGRRRLLEMGFVSGSEVRVVRLAPLLDPIEVALHGYNLSIRRSEAETILVTRS